MINLRQILNSQCGVLEGKRVKLVRHKDRRAEYSEIVKNRAALLDYQRQQSRDVFEACDYIVSFIGLDRGRSLFFGVFKVNGCKFDKNEYWYDLEQVGEFNDLVDRLVIDWGNNPRVWLQWHQNHEKGVVEILPQGYIGSFPGLLDFVLEFDDLKKLIENPAANHSWKHHLAAVNGVYLILDSFSGKQYIGSAYGDQGIWGRWSSYVGTGHGNNRELKKLTDVDPDYHRHFRFSVLQSLPSNVSAREIIEVESLYKNKLGSISYGLNAN